VNVSSHLFFVKFTCVQPFACNICKKQFVVRPLKEFEATYTNA